MHYAPMYFFHFLKFLKENHTDLNRNLSSRRKVFVIDNPYFLRALINEKKVDIKSKGKAAFQILVFTTECRISFTY